MEGKRLAIAIPASVVSDIPHLREKTSKVGLIGRAAAIFRVNQIIIYPDSPKSNQKDDMELIATLLAYMETPSICGNDCSQSSQSCSMPACFRRCGPRIIRSTAK